MSFILETYHKRILADTITPVSVYLKIRDKFPNSILLESSDYHANDNSFSYICCNPIASIKIQDEQIVQQFPDGSKTEVQIDQDTDVTSVLNNFRKQFEVQNHSFKFINNGLFGYMGYDSVRYFEDIDITKKEDSVAIPDVFYAE